MDADTKNHMPMTLRNDKKEYKKVAYCFIQNYNLTLTKMVSHHYIGHLTNFISLKI